jgi:hypothetical protein
MLPSDRTRMSARAALTAHAAAMNAAAPIAQADFSMRNPGICLSTDLNRTMERLYPKCGRPPKELDAVSLVFAGRVQIERTPKMTETK